MMIPRVSSRISRGMHKDHTGNGAATWINPIGGLGDALMISSVLKQVSELYPTRKYSLSSAPGIEKSWKDIPR